MFRLSRIFALKDHIISTLPEDQKNRFNKPDRSTATGAPFRSGIVGLEKDGVVLIVRDLVGDDGIKKTCIDSYDVQTRERKVLYKHETAARIVSASTNIDKTLLAFTTLTRYRTDRKSIGGKDSHTNYDYEEIYESCLVEIQPQAKCYSLNIRSREHQRIQFLNTSEHGGGSGGRGSVGYTNFLFFLDREFIHLYLITTQKRVDSEGIRIIAQPHLHAVVQKLYLWYYWDTLRASLYVLVPARSGTTTSPGNSGQKASDQERERSGNRGASASIGGGEQEHLLRCLVFPGIKRGELVFEIPLSIHTPRPLREVSTTEDAVKARYSALSQPLSLPQSLTLVRMRGNAILLCQQHAVSTSSPLEIRITIFALHQNGKLELTVPLLSMPPEMVRRTKVMFLSWGDLLFVYVPMHYLQAVDIGPEHEASESLILGPEFATPLPYQDSLDDETSLNFDASIASTDPALAVPFDVRLPPTTEWPAPGKPDLRGHSFLDCRQGVVYEFSIDRGVLFNLLTGPSTISMRVKALHLAMIHMQDKELVDQVMAHLCSSSSSASSAPAPDFEVLKEFLVGSTYQTSREKIEPSSGAGRSLVLSLLPISTLKAYEDVEDSPFTPITVLPHVLPGSAGQTFKRFSIAPDDDGSGADGHGHGHGHVGAVNAAMSPQPADIGSPNVQGGGRAVIRGWLGRLFGVDEDAAAAAAAESELLRDEEAEAAEGTATPGRHGRRKMAMMVSDYLSAALAKNGSKTKLNVAKFAQDFVAQRMVQSTRLFNFILSGISPSTDGNTSTNVNVKIEDEHVFRLMEQLFWALEELSYPLPQGFHAQFAALGLKCLSHSLFLQYVDRGIIRVTDAFVKELVESRDGHGEDDAFYYALVTRLESREVAVDVLKTDHAAHRSLLEDSLQCASYGRDAFAPLFGAAYELTALPVSPEVLDRQLQKDGGVNVEDGWGRGRNRSRLDSDANANSAMEPWNEAKLGPPPEFIPMSLFLNSLNMAVSVSDFQGSSLTPGEVSFLNENARSISIFPVPETPIGDDI